jgi:hypothetical protein
MSKWKITKNKNCLSRFDRLITEAEGEYENVTEAMAALNGFELVTRPGGCMWAYDADFEGIADDVMGFRALASVEMVVE